MALTENQKAILVALSKDKLLSKSELEEKCSPGYYANGAKHFGDMLSRLVNRRLIHRPKKGYYAIGRGPGTADVDLKGTLFEKKSE